MTRCTATHQFDDEPLGRTRQCALEIEDTHGATSTSPHLYMDPDSDRVRWWCSYTRPRPTPTAGPAIVDLVLQDFLERDRVGVRRYGTRLQAGNGRDVLRDAYEEALDLALYLRQAIEERTKD